MQFFRPFTVVFLLALLLGLGCGQTEDIFGSLDGVPKTGVAPWNKLDLDGEKELIQPYVIYGEPGTILTEPHYLIVGETHYCFYEVVYLQDEVNSEEIVASEIHLATSPNGIDYQEVNGGLPILTGGRDWEGGYAGGPYVLYRNDTFYMWYAGDQGAGIGVAFSEDAITWQKHSENPVLTPDQQWEGGPAGVISSPAVLHHKGKFLMYYSGGVHQGPTLARRVGYAIGYAESEDGYRWTKRDAAGRDNTDGSDSVEPIFTASQEWEGYAQEDWTLGSVASPFVMVDHPADRDIYRMYYTGHFIGAPFSYDVSVGYAGSFDGLNWQPAAPGINPVLQELFPLTLPGLSAYLLYGEWAPSVIKNNGKYYMLFAQHEPMNLVQGVGIAVHPDR